MQVKLLDLTAQYQRIRDEIRQAIDRVCDAQAFVLGPTVEQFEKRLAEYRRIKNNETGWLTYLWHLRMDMIFEVIREDLETILEKLNARERYEEENDFYICKACGMLYTFNEAMDSEFICPVCDQQMEHFDNEILLRALKKRIEAIKETLGHA